MRRWSSQEDAHETPVALARNVEHVQRRSRRRFFCFGRVFWHVHLDGNVEDWCDCTDMKRSEFCWNKRMLLLLSQHSAEWALPARRVPMRIRPPRFPQLFLEFHPVRWSAQFTSATVRGSSSAAVSSQPAAAFLFFHAGSSHPRP